MAQVVINTHWSLLAVLMSMALTGAQNIFDCPDPWIDYSGFCYKFSGDLPKKYDDAAATCSLDGSGLLYISSVEEHTYIKNWLEKSDPYRRQWLTSGHGNTRTGGVAQGETAYIWSATSQIIQATLQFWLPGQPNNSISLSTSVIAYTFGETGYGWSIVSVGTISPYICKLPKSEAYRIVQTSRDYDFGIDVTNNEILEKGPHFILVPNSLVVVGQTGESAVLECIASGYPEPTYRWFRGSPNFTAEVTADLDPRYTLTNGRLSIQKPKEVNDAFDYRCQATNKFGTIISGAVTISFGALGEFSNVQNAPARAYAYDGVAVQCSQISYKPAVTFQWMKGFGQFIRPEMQSYIFISNNGKIYFSEVTRADEGNYQCIAMLTGVNEYAIGTSQPPTRTSLPIPLVVMDQTPKADWGPEIQNDFPAVFPQPPLRGQNVRLECFAYGSSTSAFYYSWSRKGLPIPATAVFEDYNRVMTIRNAQMEDSGTYTCLVMRTSSKSDSRSITLTLGARPYFVAPLKDQHADIGSQLTWRCDARGNPVPTYRWYKNGKLLVSDNATRVVVNGNLLTITKLDDALHAGMYQCGAFNQYGSEMSNAQIRVLSFAPTFSKQPLPQGVSGPVGGSLTIVCNPEGAPQPQITWLRNGAILTTDAVGRITQLANGNLVIKELQNGDAGDYTCKAVNQNGEASSSTRLQIAVGTSITLGPTSTSEIVNSTVFLSCQASRDPTMDMVYVWYFNGHLLDTTLATYSKIDSDANSRTGLYVKSVQFEHEGEYRCVVRTPYTMDARSAYLTVRGPPGMPAGVMVKQGTVTQSEAVILWTVGTDHGGTIFTYQIECQDEFNPGIWVLKSTLSASETLVPNIQTDKREAKVTDLNPGTGYEFRVLAVNEFGVGAPSAPSAFIKTLDAPPAVAPSNVRGGGGSVGDLTIRWDKLNRAEWGSNSVWYRVFWRKQTNNIEEDKWDSATKTGDDDYHVTLVGKDNFYLIYDVKVQALNPLGQGPNSTIEEVYSAEDLPLATPTNVAADTYNCSAISVSWVPVEDTREVARGKVLGYQINYWPDWETQNSYRRFIRYYGQVEGGLVIGLGIAPYKRCSNVNTIVNVQVYNSAGLGPQSETYLMETAFEALKTYPQEVRVYSAGAGRARVWWRGCNIITEEAGLRGYVIFYWNANEDSRSAKEARVPWLPTETVLEGLDPNTMYALRIAATNDGGDGARTPTVYFTYEGSVYINYAFSQTIDVYLAPADVSRPCIALMLAVVSSSIFWIS